MSKKKMMLLTALSEASRRSDITDLCEKNPELLGLFDEFGYNGLMLAQSHGVAKSEINAGVDINAKNACGMTAMHMHIRYCQVGLVPLLLKNGSDINCKDQDGVTPLMYAFIHRNLSLAEYLILSGADLNVQDNFGHSALHYAVIHREIKFQRLFLKNGADMNIENNHEASPLSMTLNFGTKKMVKLFEEYSKKDANH